jgi:uncharacterized iron-regulated protein
MRYPVLIVSLLLAALFPGQAGAGEKTPDPVPDYRIEVSFDISRSAVLGTVRVPVRAGQELAFRTGHLNIAKVSINGRPADHSQKEGTLLVRPSEDGTVEIDYEGLFKGGEALGSRNYGVVPSTIDGRGISLTNLWYPHIEALARYRLTAVFPQGYEAVSEADVVTKKTKGSEVEFTFDFPHPVDGISLVAANRFEITTERAGDIELSAYFFKEDRELAKTYLQYAKKYFELYEGMLTKYPYKRFSIVENFLPTGYSMPTFTLLGQDVVRLPFIVETSLGHEILHQWFGNSVYADQGKGNWTEGLTAYLADHLYDEQKGKGWEHRKQLLINYGSYVNAGNEFSLREFRSRTDFASRAVGYGKAAMVFHMLRRAAGDEAFFASLREFISQKQFRQASWEDIRAALEKKSGKDLSAFFRYWVDGKGLPEVQAENAKALRKGDGFEISFDLIRKNCDVPLDIPVTVSFVRGGEKHERVSVDAEKKRFVLNVPDEPSGLATDRDYDVARRLADREMPPVIARLVGDEKPVLALPSSGRERFAAAIEGFKKRGGVEKEAEKIKDAEIKESSLVLFGTENPLIRRLFGSLDLPEAGFGIAVRKNPWNSGKVVAIVQAKSAEETDAAFEKIFHYGKYSSLTFEAGRNTSKKIESSERGILMELRAEPPVVDLSALKGLSHAIEGAREKKIVYVGEYHDRFSHHTIQLRIIKELHRENPNLAVGMEMFQRPFQKTLDDYIAGSIDEREFLARSEYFKRWSFDYNLYKPILDFARAEKVPVIALNVRREITEKVSKQGMDSLTEEDRKETPPDLDFSDEQYRERLREVFAQHKGSEEKNFDFFLQAQILWDETMAQSIDEYLKDNPDRRMVVIAGGGHLQFGSGIPKRTFRRNGLPYTIILNDAEVEQDIADYIVFPEPLEGATSPRLKATFKEEGGRLRFTGFVKDSPAKTAGLRTGDVLVSLDGAEVKALQDVKLALFYKKKGDIIRVGVVRKRFLLGERELVLDVKL